MAQFVKNVVNFMKQIVSHGNDCNVEKSNPVKNSKPVEKSRWMSQDNYLEKKYKRVKIYNGETFCTPHASLAESISNNNTKSRDKSCDQTESSTEDITDVDEKLMRDKCSSLNPREKKKETERHKCLIRLCNKSINTGKTESGKRMNQEKQDSTATDSKSVSSVAEDEDAPQCPPCNIKKRKRNVDSCEHLDEKLRDMFLIVREKCLKKNFDEIEQSANALWRDCSTKLPDCENCNSNHKQWENLNSIEKLPFYWAAISGAFLHEAPFDNFLRYFLDENDIDDKYVDNSEFMQHVQMLWRNMEEMEKMPFIMESFLYRVSIGKVNMQSDRCIKDELKQIYNRTLCNHLF